MLFPHVAPSLQFTPVHQHQSKKRLVEATFPEVGIIHPIHPLPAIHHPPLHPLYPRDPHRDALDPLAPCALFLGTFYVLQPHAAGEEDAEDHEGRKGDAAGHQEGSHRGHLGKSSRDGSAVRMAVKE